MAEGSEAERLGVPPAAGPLGTPPPKRLKKDGDDDGQVTVKPVVFRSDPTSKYVDGNARPADPKSYDSSAVRQSHGSDSQAVVIAPKGGIWVVLFHEEDHTFGLAFMPFPTSEVGVGTVLSRFIEGVITEALTVEKFAVCDIAWEAPAANYTVKIPAPKWLALDGARPQQTLSFHGLKDVTKQALCLRVHPPSRSWPASGFPCFAIPIWCLERGEDVGVKPGVPYSYSHLLPLSDEKRI